MKAALEDSGSMASNASTMPLLRKLGIRHSHLPAMAVAFVLLCLVAKIFWPTGAGVALSILSDTAPIEPVPQSQKHDKWIVITSVQSPTKPIKTLAQMSGWKVLVVGDKKTPKDWSVPGVVFLSVEMQEQLPYSLVKLTPYKSYSRKNIGYLYAIHHGAKVIYETDDDNLAEGGLDEVFQLSEFSWSLIIDTHNLTYNPYVHFGQSTTWPRGYPLEYLPLPTPHKYKLCKMPTAVVQQGVVNGDPDLDATFRLTRKNSFKRIDVYFDLKAPPVVLPVNTYSPYNCQDTLVTYDGFWSLMLPLTKNMRTLDIYRGYLAEKLLWMIGQRLEFVATDTYQERNVHSYIKDAEDEIEFLGMGKFVNELNSWVCSRQTFFECVEEAFELAYKAGFYNKLDVDAAKAWLHDLVRMGYRPPLLNKARDICIESHDKDSVFFYGEEQNTVMFHTPEKFVPSETTGRSHIRAELTALCAGKSSPLHFSSRYLPVRDVLLIIDVADNYDSIPALDAWYRPQVSQILFCGHGRAGIEEISSQWMVSIIAPASGRVSSMSGCLYLASKMGYKTRGYMYVQKDMLFMHGSFKKLEDSIKMTQNIVQSTSPCKLDCLPVKKEELEVFSKLKPNLEEFRSSDQNKIMTCAKHFADSISKDAVFQHTIAFYLPTKRNMQVPIVRFAEAYLDKFSAQIADIFTAVISTCIDPNHTPFLHATFEQKLSVDYIHPFGFIEMKKDNNLLSYYCANVHF